MVATLELTIDGQTFTVEVGDLSSSPVTVVVNGVTKSVSFRDVAAGAAAGAGAAEAQAPAPAEAQPAAPAAPAPEAAPAPAVVPPAAVSGERIVAPMPGKILSVRVKVGDTVKQGDPVVTLEAMKMEMPISATAGGTVKAIHVRVGDTVANDAPLVTVG